MAAWGKDLSFTNFRSETKARRQVTLLETLIKFELYGMWLGSDHARQGALSVNSFRLQLCGICLCICSISYRKLKSN